jgi:hypothetical protein
MINSFRKMDINILLLFVNVMTNVGLFGEECTVFYRQFDEHFASESKRKINWMTVLKVLFECRLLNL